LRIFQSKVFFGNKYKPIVNGVVKGCKYRACSVNKLVLNIYQVILAYGALQGRLLADNSLNSVNVV